MSELIKSLKRCSVSGNVVSLPPITSDPLPNYADVRKALINAGGKYKNNTFLFPNAAQPYMDKLLVGQSVNIKKEFQFFATSPELADELVRLAEFEKTHTVLEPSAGDGAIVNAIYRYDKNMIVHCWELMDANREIIKTLPNAYLCGEDFLEAGTSPLFFDRIIANPPFTKNQDIDHIYKMFELLKPGGRIVTITSTHWIHASGKKEMAFNQWLKTHNAEIINMPAGAFKKSGTNVATTILIINRP